MANRAVAVQQFSNVFTDIKVTLCQKKKKERQSNAHLMKKVRTGQVTQGKSFYNGTAEKNTHAHIYIYIYYKKKR